MMTSKQKKRQKALETMTKKKQSATKESSPSFSGHTQTSTEAGLKEWDLDTDEVDQELTISKSQLSQLIQRQVRQALKLSEGQTPPRDRLVLGASKAKEPAEILTETFEDPARLEPGLAMLRQRFGKLPVPTTVYDCVADKKEILTKTKSSQQDLSRIYSTLVTFSAAAEDRLTEEEMWTLQCVTAMVGLLEQATVHNLWKLHLDKLGPSISLTQKTSIITRNWEEKDLCQAADETVMLEKDNRTNKTLETFISMASKRSRKDRPDTPSPTHTPAGDTPIAPPRGGRGSSGRSRGDRSGRGRGTQHPTDPETAPPTGGEVAGE